MQWLWRSEKTIKGATKMYGTTDQKDIINDIINKAKRVLPSISFDRSLDASSKQIPELNGHTFVFDCISPLDRIIPWVNKAALSLYPDRPVEMLVVFENKNSNKLKSVVFRKFVGDTDRTDTYNEINSAEKFKGEMNRGYVKIYRTPKTSRAVSGVCIYTAYLPAMNNEVYLINYNAVPKSNLTNTNEEGIVEVPVGQLPDMLRVLHNLQ